MFTGREQRAWLMRVRPDGLHWDREAAVGSFELRSVRL